MTNTVFFPAIYREDESVSSSSRSETSEPPQTEAQASSSAYSVVGKALLACARPQLEADEDVDDSTANTSAPASNTNENGSVVEDSELKRISYKELQTATSGFHTSNKLESGEFVSVFKGWIDENTLTATASGKGIAVAVKRLHWLGATSFNEINYLGRFHHPNLVKTLAYCTEKPLEPMVVYEFMPQGSLADHLFQRGSNSKPLSWSLRLKIALGAAKGLNFLHMNNAVHGNISPSNILLDSYYNSKLSFGVARDSPWGGYTEPIHRLRVDELDYYDVNYVNEYTTPECIREGDAIATGDVYSFGVVLLEILSWRKVTKAVLELAQTILGDKRFVDSLIGSLDRRLADNLIGSLDRRLWGDECSKRVIRRAFRLAKLCISQEPRCRKTMDLVVQDLIAIEKIHKKLIRASPM